MGTGLYFALTFNTEQGTIVECQLHCLSGYRREDSYVCTTEKEKENEDVGGNISGACSDGRTYVS